MSTLAIPTGVRARQLFGLARCEPLPPPRSEDGWDVYALEGLDVERQDEEGRWVGNHFQLALRSATHPGRSEQDELAEAGLTRAARRGAWGNRCLTELMVVLGCLLDLDSKVGLFRWRRFAEILHGPEARADRHNKAPQRWLALFIRARVNFDPEARTSPETWTQLVALEEHNLTARTVRLDPSFRRELAAVTREVDVDDLYLGLAPVDEREPNPEGNKPSRWARARACCSLLLELAPSRQGEAPRDELELEIGDGLLTKYGMDLAQVQRRRHLPTFILPLVDDLLSVLRRASEGIATVLDRPGSVLRRVLRLRHRRPRPNDRAAGANGHSPGHAAPAVAPATRGPPLRR